ncbi:hypothetical protein VP01_2342g1 [Puccinia sorghi]|uniref:Uncharacterized protein n=1 Tax=Puccinia sorghi TaxID=27349 RepID=A0A0L6V7A7_9BASI|nr:hypothetical protein VP01_2342g1 [Puccinia sorghi]
MEPTASSIQNPPSDSDDRSAFLKLIRKITGMPLALKKICASDKNHQQKQSTHSANIEDSAHLTISIRKFIPNLFLPDPPIERVIYETDDLGIILKK